MTDSHQHPLTNGFDPDQIQGFLDQIAKLDDELLSLKGEYMARCKGPRGRIKDIVAQAREAGMKPKAFREVLEKARDDRKRQARIDAFEADDRDCYEMILASLGDFAETPLGRATLERARPQHDGGQTELQS